MSERAPRAFVAATLAVALVLQLLELPYALAMLRPLFVPLVLVYWAMVVPQPGGLLTAWLAGLMLDALLGTALGQHALGLTVLVFITLRLRGWLTLFPIWQEAAVLTAFWFVYAFLMFWIDGATGHRADPWLHWVPVLSSGLCWPMVFAGLNRLRRRALRDPLTL